MSKSVKVNYPNLDMRLTELTGYDNMNVIGGAIMALAIGILLVYIVKRLFINKRRATIIPMDAPRHHPDAPEWDSEDLGSEEMYSEEMDSEEMNSEVVTPRGGIVLRRRNGRHGPVHCANLLAPVRRRNYTPWGRY